MNNQFVHLHLHTNFSLLDGYGSPLSRVKKAKELGMNAIAITDHNILSGCYSFQEACKENDMRCILGVELYYTEDMKMLCIPPEERNGRTKDECKKVMAKKRKEIALETAIANGVDIPKKAKKNEIDNLIKDYEYDTKQFHILFLAKNQIGWNNLVKLQSEAARLCEYNGRNICDDRLIEKYKDGLIMTTACVGGIISNYFLKGEVDKAYEKLDKWHEMFGDDFYIEIQPHSFDKQVICNKYLIQYAIANNIKLISTNDVHYNNKSDHKDHDILVRIGIKTPLSKESKMSYLNEYWVRSYDEMIEAYEQQWLLSMKMNIELAENYNQFLNIVKISLNNTNEIADKISQDIKLKYDKPALPKIKIPNNLSSSDYLSYISYRGLFKYLKNNKTLNMNTYINRLSYELNIINKKGYADYLLIVKEILDWCKENNIPTGPGRGSAGGSLILFVNNMTKCIDPVKYGLLFERFLTMDRTSLPDIDSDLSYLNRGRVIQHLKDKYGENCVSYICNITELGVKNGLKDVGRILDIDFNTMNEITKKIDEISDEDPNTTFKSLDALKEGNDTEKIKYKEFYNLENKYKEIFRLARAFEGTPRNLGVDNLAPVKLS